MMKTYTLLPPTMKLSLKFSLAKSRKKWSKLKENESWVAESKPKKTLIGTQFTNHLSCAQKSQNFDCGRLVELVGYITGQIGPKNITANCVTYE